MENLDLKNIISPLVDENNRLSQEIKSQEKIDEIIVQFKENINVSFHYENV